MTIRRRLVLFVMVTAAACLVTGGIALWVLFRAAFAEQSERLLDTARVHAGLIDAVARHHLQESGGDREFAIRQSLVQVREAHRTSEGLGATGELLLARSEAGEVVFLTIQRFRHAADLPPLPLDDPAAEPMRRALAGQSGVLVGVDYRGQEVLSAYAPVDVLGLGAVAKLDLAEIRAPFVRAGLLCALGAALVLALASLLLVRLYSPLGRRIEEGEALHEAIVAEAADGIVTVSAAGLIESANPAAEAMFGYRGGGLAGLRLEHLLPATGREQVQHWHERALEQGHAALFASGRELTGCRRDGTTFPLELSLSAVRLADRSIFAGILRDVSRRKQDEQALQRERDFAEGLIETAPAIVLVLDAEGRIVRFNGFMEKLGGRPLADVRHEDWLQIFVPTADRERRRQTFRRVLGGIPTRGMASPIVTADGSLREIEWHDTTMRTPEGLAAGVLSVGLDVTERRRLEEEFLQAQKLEAVGRLAGGIAHDFNNLLMGILSACRVAARRLPAGSTAGELLAEVQDEARRGTDLTRQLLDFSRVQHAHAEPVEVNAVVADAETMIRRLVGEDVTLHVDLDPRCGAVVADAGRLGQVLMNLAVNARDAMPEGGALAIRTGRAELDAAGARGLGELSAGSYEQIVVADSGAGMDEDTRARAFDPFFTTKGAGKGTGLGLSTVFGIVRHFDGHIELDSAPGQGTTARMWFPCATRQAAAPAPAPAPEPALARGDGEAVLVVEDERLVRVGLRHLLKGLGYRVWDVGSGREALALCDQEDQPLDLLLTDIVMPEMNGGELARQVMRRRPGVRTIYMSAFSHQTLVEQGRLPPGQPTLEKPFDEASLAAKLREVLEAPVRASPEEVGAPPS